ncbi:MAG: phage distal tail protein [Halanaerobiales bacterium]
MVEVFSGNDVFLSIAPKTIKTNDVTTDNNFEIDNRGNKNVFPKFTILFNNTTNIQNIQNGDQLIEFDNLSISDGDELVLDFKEQVYELNGENVIDDLNFPNNKLIYLISNEVNEFSVDTDEELDIEVEYDSYDVKKIMNYKTNLSITRRPNYNELKPYNDIKILDRKLQEMEYVFTIGKHALDWVESDKEYRIEYEEYNEDTLDSNYKYLVGVVFSDVSRGFDEPTGIINNRFSGSAIDILNKKI